MKEIIITEQSNPNSENIDVSTSLEIVEIINNEDKKVLKAIEKEKQNIAKAIDLISEKFLKNGSLIYFGAGTSGRLGVLDASECPPTFGVETDLVKGYIAGGDIALKKAIEGAEDNFEQGLLDYKNAKVKENDVIVGISASGNPKWLIAIMQEAKKNNVSTIGITCNKEAKIKQYSDIFISPIVEQEVITGSSRMKAGTAQKMILNMLSTGSMIKIGKTYKNFMIDVQPTNEKLKKRAERIVSEIANVNIPEAKKSLELTDYNVKISIISLIKKISFEEAKKLLNENNGILRKII